MRVLRVFLWENSIASEFYIHLYIYSCISGISFNNKLGSEASISKIPISGGFDLTKGGGMILNILYI